LQKKRIEYIPVLPEVLADLTNLTFVQEKEKTMAKGDIQTIKKYFPRTFARPILTVQKGEKKSFSPQKIGVVFSGGQASGGHNVISGIFDALEKMHKDSQLWGFLNGPSGIIENKTREITKEFLQPFRNQGGFDLIGSGRTKIETEEQLQSSLKTCKELQLDGLVIIGGDDSNTNAAVLAEYFLTHGCNTQVIGVPKTIDGDLKNEHVKISFGFDTACKVYSELIGNIERDALSAKKYYHFIKLMGRSASHIALECALKTQPNYTFIGEEVFQKKETLQHIIEKLKTMIVQRHKAGKNYGVILIPEGLIEFIPEVKNLIQELNAFLVDKKQVKLTDVQKALSEKALNCFSELPEKIQEQLLLSRDPHGNVKVSQIETESLLIAMLKPHLADIPFHTVSHFFGYEGRSAIPSNFDANYCYALGHLAALLIADKKTGYMCCISDLTNSPKKWGIKALPITMFMRLETRKGKKKPVIEKALVNCNEKPFSLLQAQRKKWALEDHYQYPGAIQYFADSSLTDTVPLSLLE
jgi:diphosphate-dependent phosphofructokinase